jgi:thiamine-monophosphate kinase
VTDIQKGERNIELAPGGEFDIIRRLFDRWGPRVRGAGDDAAMLDVPPNTTLVASTDSAVDRIHFRRDWITAEEIGYRVTTAALSDLAAMAADPLGMLIAIAAPSAYLPELDALAVGIGRAVEIAGTHIVGGDLSSAGELVIGVTVLGSAPRPIRRDGARVGDALYVTGTLGGPSAATRAWYAGDEPRAEWRDRYVRPVARLREARWLAERGASAMIDISDGLLADAAHLARASGVALHVRLDAIPAAGGVRAEDAASGGDEYELLLSAPATIATDEFASRFGVPLTRIGSVERGPAEVMATIGGERVAPRPGFSHFS